MNLSKVKWPKVILFGDSLTQNCLDPHNGMWGALLAHKLQRISDVVTRGFSGYNSRQCNYILPRIFSSEDVSEIKAFVIFIGANDYSKSSQHVPLIDFSKYLKDMVRYLESIDLCKEKIILLTPPPYCDEKYTSFCLEIGREKSERDNETGAQYAKEICEVGKACNVEVLDVFSEMIKDENWESYLIDGLHFSAAGANKLYNLLWPYIEKRVDTSSLFMPLWGDEKWNQTLK